MTPSEMADTLREISAALGEDMPTTPRQFRFWQVRIVNTIKAHRKKADMYDKSAEVFRSIVHGK